MASVSDYFGASTPTDSCEPVLYCNSGTQPHAAALKAPYSFYISRGLLQPMALGVFEEHALETAHS